MLTKTGWPILIAAFTVILAWAVYRDIHFEQQYTSDLRNRVTGARLEMDHRSPYFFTWKSTDPMRYYDPENRWDSTAPLRVSNITASPFFLHLMQPIANLQQRTISRIWLLIEYLLLAIATGIGLALAANRTQKAMVLLAVALFLLTEAWQQHIANGQSYLLIPVLALLFYFFFRKKNCLILFLPFLFVIKRYSLKSLAVFFLPVVLLVTWSLASREERSFWLDYKKFLGEVVKGHQAGIDFSKRISKDVYPGHNYEGLRREEIDAAFEKLPYKAHSEHANVFVLYENIFHRKVNLAILGMACIACMVVLAGCYVWTHRSRTVEYDLLSLAILGYCLYMIADLFSPVWRHQYYTTQWLCPLLLAASAWRPSQRNFFLLLGAGLVLNIVNLSFMKMEHSIGEYLFCLVLLLMVLLPGERAVTASS
jgi:hypothetical protein